MLDLNRRELIISALSAVTCSPIAAASSLPDPEVIEDVQGPSTLHRATDLGPLIYLSHRLGGEPKKGRQREAPWQVLDALRRRGFHILRSADAGPQTYGNDQALAYCTRMCGRALQRIDWDGRLFALGISMGALTALQMSWKGLFPHKVTAVATIDGAMNLHAIHASPIERRRRIEVAYGVHRSNSFSMASRGHDPLHDFPKFPQNNIPFIAFGSRNDTVLPIQDHAVPMVSRSRSSGATTQLVLTDGGHISAEHFTLETADMIAGFFSAATEAARHP